MSTATTTERADNPSRSVVLKGHRFAPGHKFYPPKKRSAGQSPTAVAHHVPFQSWATKIKLLKFEDIDGRTKDGKLLRTTIREREAARGGNLSDEQFKDLTTMVVLEFIIEHMNVMKIQGNPDFNLQMYHTVIKDLRILRQRL
jgi:hypothetical protein